MTETVIILMIAGVICIALSYIFSEAVLKHGNEKEENEEKKQALIQSDFSFSDEDLEIIREKVEDAVSQYCEDAIYKTESTLATLSNEKTLALGDYAVTVCDEIEKNHKEVMFLYSMLNDKEKEILALVNEIGQKKAELKELLEKVSQQEASRVEVKEEKPAEEEKQEKEQQDDDLNLDGLEKEFALQEDTDFEEIDNGNTLILELYKSGMNIVEIAKQLGLGVGEVKLIVDLYQGESL